MIRTVQCSNGFVVTGSGSGSDPDSIKQFQTFFEKSVSKAAKDYKERMTTENESVSEGKQERVWERLSNLEGKQRSFELTVKIATGTILALGLGLGAYQHWDQISSYVEPLKNRITALFTK